MCVLVEVVRLHRGRLAVPVDLYWSGTLWGQLAEHYLTSPLPGLRRKMRGFFISLVLALTERSVLCSVPWGTLLKSQGRRHCPCAVLLGLCRSSLGCHSHVPGCHSDRSQRGTCSFSPFVMRCTGITLTPVTTLSERAVTSVVFNISYVEMCWSSPK